ncbi:hypothetical protein HanIR_Chr09g0421081 [Helianthus annuus]|nr:hypothetical protein HanIR_Chr09g0421081 [Helianthus annuus]
MEIGFPRDTRRDPGFGARHATIVATRERTKDSPRVSQEARFRKFCFIFICLIKGLNKTSYISIKTNIGVGFDYR